MRETDEINNVITKSNALIRQTIDSLDRREHYLLAVLLGKFKQQNFDITSVEQLKPDDFKVSLKLIELINFLHLTPCGANFENYRKVIAHFQGRAFYWWLDGTKRAYRVSMFPKISIPHKWLELDNFGDSENDDLINFYFSPEFVKELIVNTNFTKLYTESIISLKSERSIKLYQLLKSHANQQHDITYTIEDLRIRLNMTSKSYDRFNNFFPRGIKEPIDEINENTEIHITVKKNYNKKDKRKVDSLTFKIRDNSSKKVWWTEYPKIKLTDKEYTEVTTWINPVHHRSLLVELETRLEDGEDIRNHYKWLTKNYNIYYYANTGEMPNKKSRYFTPKYDSYVEIYNNTHDEMQIKNLTPKRKRAITKFASYYTLEDFKKICNISVENPYLAGCGDDGWVAHFDWLINIENATRILEGEFGEEL